MTAPPSAPRLALAALACAALTACATATEAPAGPPGRGGPPTGPRAVRVVTADVAPVESVLRLTGEFRARDVSPIAPSSSGQLVELTIEEGDAVEVGAVVARLDAALEQQALERAQAARGTASARVALAEASRDEHLAEVERRRGLLRAGTLAQAEFDALEARGPVLEAEIALARAQLAEAESAVRAARLEVERRAVRAPVAGVVVERLVSVGAWVTPQTPVAHLVDGTNVEFVAAVAEPDVPRVELGSEVRVALADGASWVGRIERLAPQVTADSRTVEVVVVGPEAPRAGTFGAATVVLARTTDETRLPLEALTRNETAEGVWVVEGSGVAFEPVQVVLRGERTVAVDGVAPGASVVVDAPRGLTDGAQVIPVPASALSEAERRQ